jgi:hypothetical protein
VLRERGEHVLEQWLSLSGRLLRPVEHGDRADCRRERRDERGCVERLVEPNLQQADALAVGTEPLDGLFGRSCTRAHEHEHALGLRVADVVE